MNCKHKPTIFTMKPSSKTRLRMTFVKLLAVFCVQNLYNNNKRVVKMYVGVLVVYQWKRLVGGEYNSTYDNSIKTTFYNVK